MRPQPEKPPQAGKREGDEDRCIVRAVGRERPASRRELDTRTGIPRLRFGPLGFSYCEARRIVRPVAEIEAAARSQCCDEGKKVTR